MYKFKRCLTAINWYFKYFCGVVTPINVLWCGWALNVVWFRYKHNVVFYLEALKEKASFLYNGVITQPLMKGGVDNVYL